MKKRILLLVVLALGALLVWRFVYGESSASE